MININKCGFNDQHPPGFQIYRPNGSNDYLILLLRSQGYFMLNNSVTGDYEEYSIPANSIFIYKKGTPQIYGGHDMPFADDWIHFNFRGDESFYDVFRDIPVETPFAVPDSQFIRKIFHQFVAEFYNDSLLKAEVLDHLFHILVIKIREQLLLPANNIHTHKLYPALNRIRNEMRSAPGTLPTVDEAAKRASISVSYFQHLYKQFFNVTFVSDLIKAKTELSKYYLSGTRLSIKDIAELCGYENEVHYMRQFKKNVGMTPSEYRWNYFTGM